MPYQSAQKLNQNIKGSVLVPFQYSGHGAFWEERDKLIETIIKFV
ncbi:hypothetical protein [Paraliobacillus sp. X-1268]